MRQAIYSAIDREKLLESIWGDAGQVIGSMVSPSDPWYEDLTSVNPYDPERSGEYFALRIRGESMINAGILDGDMIIVRRQDTADNGEIVVALLGDEATCKRLSRSNGEVWLLPENDAFSPIDGREASILGKVTAVIRKY